MNLDGLSFSWLIAIFVCSAVVIWLAGIQLAKTTGILSKYFGIGQALGGMIILAFVTNLPEVVITISASLQNKVELAVGNILGGIGIQTVVLVILDAFGVKQKEGLTNKATSLEIALEGLLVIAILVIVVMGSQLPKSLIFLRLTPSVLLILITWLAGLFLLNKAQKGLPWKLENKKNENDIDDSSANNKNKNMAKTVAIFSGAAVATLVAGLALEKSGDVMSGKIGMQGIFFGATILAASTSLPEISTGLASVKQKQYELAISDIFGGNAFLPVLFLLATLISGKPVLPSAKNADIYLTAVAMMLTLVYVWGIIFRPKKQILHMGVDSFIVLIIYLLSLGGLFVVARL